MQGDPFKTLFVGRISYEATEKRLRREFEEYGPIKRIRLVQEKDTGAAPLLCISPFCHTLCNMHCCLLHVGCRGLSIAIVKADRRALHAPA